MARRVIRPNPEAPWPGWDPLDGAAEVAKWVQAWGREDPAFPLDSWLARLNALAPLDLNNLVNRLVQLGYANQDHKLPESDRRARQQRAATILREALPGALPVLVLGLRCRTSIRARMAAGDILVAARVEEAAPALLSVTLHPVEDRSHGFEVGAFLALGVLKSEWLEWFRGGLDSADERIRKNSAQVLASAAADDRAFPALFAKRTNPEFLPYVIGGCAFRTDEDSLNFLRKCVRSKDLFARRDAARALVRRGDASAQATLDDVERKLQNVADRM